MTDTSYAAPGPWGDPLRPCLQPLYLLCVLLFYAYICALIEGPHDRHKQRLDCAWALGVLPRTLSCSLRTFHAYFYAYIYIYIYKLDHRARFARTQIAEVLWAMPHG
jgi:hypothetical protein